MLAILGVLGAVFAGLMADGIIGAMGSKNVEDENVQESEDASETMDGTAEELTGDEPASLLDWAADNADAVAPVPEPILGDEGDDILTGGEGDDAIHGGDGNDLLGGRSGDDLIKGGAGEDNIEGEDGNDSLAGGAGNDSVRGGLGHDVISGGEGEDQLSGQEGNDTLSGESGDDTLMGGAGEDLLDGGEGDDWLAGGYGDDTLIGGVGSDTLDGDAGDDVLSGLEPDGSDAEVDFLNGGEGNDSLLIGSGDYATGGEGEDTFTLGDWIDDTNLPTVADFDPAADDIVVVYDAEAHPSPELSLISEDGSDDATLLLDGMAVAMIKGGATLDLATVRMVPSEDP